MKKALLGLILSLLPATAALADHRDDYRYDDNRDTYYDTRCDGPPVRYYTDRGYGDRYYDDRYDYRSYPHDHYVDTHVYYDVHDGDIHRHHYHEVHNR